MGANDRVNAESLPPHAQLIQMGTTYWISRLVYAAAKLGLADRLADGPKSAAELAGPTGTHAPSLHRLMRTLASLGILTERDAQRFALTPLGEALKTGAPGSARASILTLGGPFGWRAWEQLMYSLETGKTGFEKAFGMGAFEYLAQHPDEASLFSETMIGVHGAEPDAVAAAYDFSVFGTVADVGGASGNLLAAILTRHRAPRGILFDLPHVVRDAPALLAKRGVADRVSIESGSFFETVPKGADAYVLSHIIHDWSEEQCLTILGHCRSRRTRPRPQGHEAGEQAAARRDGAPAGRHAALREDPRHDDARDARRRGAVGGRVRGAARRGRAAHDPGRSDGVGRQRGGSGPGLRLRP